MISQWWLDDMVQEVIVWCSWIGVLFISFFSYFMNIPHVSLFAVIKKKSLQEYIELTVMKL